MKGKTHMSIFNRPFLLLLVATLLPILSGCVSRQLINTRSTHMTVDQARNSLKKSLNHMLKGYTYSSGQVVNFTFAREVKFNRRRLTFIDDIGDGKTYVNHFNFLMLDSLWVEDLPNDGRYNRGWLVHYRFKGEDIPTYHFEEEEYAMMFVDALLTLKEAFLEAPDTEEADFAAFVTSAKTWLMTMPKPEMSDDALTYKALAEDAFKRKDFTAALDAYCDALDRFPMWSEGHYNAALLAAENEEYELAARHMRRYLVLAPGAKDAAAAKEKFLLWQHKAKE